MWLLHKLSALKDWVITWAGHPFAPAILFANAAAEAVFFPVPPDLLLIAMCLASATAGQPVACFIFAAICTAGSVTGGVGGYFIGLKGGRPVAERFYNKDKIAAADKLYDKYGVWAVAVAGLTPVPYCIFTVLSGALKMRLPVFVLISILSRGARFFTVATLIFFLGEPVAEFIKDDKKFGLLSIAFVVLLLGGYIVLHAYSKKHARKVRDALENDSSDECESTEGQ